MNKDSVYFPHDSNERLKPEILKLRRILKSSGYGIYWMILECLRSAPKYKLPLNCLDELAFEFHEAREIIASIINDFNLFEIENGEFFYSPFLIEKMIPLETKRKKLSEAGKKGRAKQLQLAIDDASGATPTATPGQKRKEKKRKEEKSKEELLKNKQKEFRDEINNFISEEFTQDLSNGFYNYWSEPNRSKTKMKCELERTWDLKRRINTWVSNSNKFSNNSNKLVQPGQHKLRYQ